MLKIEVLKHKPIVNLLLKNNRRLLQHILQLKLHYWHKPVNGKYEMSLLDIEELVWETLNVFICLIVPVGSRFGFKLPNIGVTGFKFNIICIWM